MKPLAFVASCLLSLFSFNLSAQSLEGDFATNRLIVKLKETYQTALQTRESASLFSFGITDIDRLNADLHISFRPL